MLSQFWRIFLTCAGALACSASSGGLAQNDDQGSTDQEVVLDTVEITGTQDDPAMAAFRAGDFETAESEFLANAMCALRRERNRLASIETARTNASRAEAFGDAFGVESGASTRGANAGSGQTAQVGIAAPDGVAMRNIHTRKDRSCEDRGRQMYFAGLSQIQLGETSKALTSFERATAASKVLYDAHYKIGLIKILQGDKQRARTELKKIERILERCRDCEARQEIIERRDHLSKAIDGQIELR